ncbi:MAG: hypothetical protein JO125_08665 [Chloroflexi bacterium]|nr:hypothetical protein [Ktedonobacteraceae bacterium]MBV9019665.1 hypothetical protein [Ktedonobacteraceae bacterium]MBV9707463.1 hypothetical protein [Chloroflexota bacterium]
MRYLRDENEGLSDDEVDVLFGQLQLIEPPEWLIQSILAAASQLLLPSLVEDEHTNLVVRSHSADPS